MPKITRGVKFFDLLRPVLEQRIKFLAERNGLSQEQVYQMVLDEAEKNSMQWFSNSPPNLNYHQPECRLAYLYIVAAANATTFKWILQNNADLYEHVVQIAKEKQQLKICAFGAGPGTELLALAKFFDEERLGQAIQVEFQLLDIEQAWLDSWYGIRDSIKTHFSSAYGSDFFSWPMFPSGNFTQQDLKDTAGLENLGDIWEHDVFVVNFVFSEIFNDDPGFRSFMTTVAQHAPKGSRFVFIERRGRMWEERITNCVCDAGLKLSPFQEETGTVDSGDSAELLGDVYLNLSNSENGKRPRKNWKVIYSIGIKE